MIKTTFSLNFLLVTNLIFGQINKIDSLTNVLIKESNPKNKIAVLFKLAEYCDSKDNLKYALPAIDLIKDLKNKTKDTIELKKLYEQEGDMYSIFVYTYYFNPIYRENKKLEECLNRALINYKVYNNWDKIEDVVNKQQGLYRKTGDVFKELQTLKNALSYGKSKGNKIVMARYIYRIADFYSIIGDSVKTMEYANQGIELEKIINKPERQNKGYYLGAELFSNINKNKNAIELYNKSLRGFLKTNDSSAISANYLGIGEAYLNLNEYDLARKSLTQALIYSDTSNTEGQLQYLRIIDNFGKIEYKLGNYQKAIEYHKFCFSKHEPWKLSGVYYTSQHRLAMDFFKLKKFGEAKKLEMKCLEWAKLWAGAKNVLQGELLLYQIDSALTNYNGAFMHYKNYIKLKEILSIEDIKKANAREELQIKYEEQVREEKLMQEKKNAEANAEIKQQKLVKNSFIVGFVLLLVLAGLVLKSYIAKRKHSNELAIKNLQISKQKHLVDEKQKEIIDSINYAERIQRSFIATKEILDENLNDYFVFFKPKDIVSGDFYWASKLNNGYFALATADSTGHGVPGAIMSLLNVTSLEKAIETHTQPSEILNATRKIIIERLKKDGSAEGGKDGMDASLTVYDFKNKKLIIAAANNPVWIVRGAETIEIKPDKMPVGKHDKDTISFTQQEVDLQTGDVVYTLTDGFSDQFGGEKGKKFMIKNLRELLIANANLPVQKQKELLEQTFTTWAGNLEQVDDVTLIGVRV